VRGQQGGQNVFYKEVGWLRFGEATWFDYSTCECVRPTWLGMTSQSPSVARIANSSVGPSASTVTCESPESPEGTHATGATGKTARKLGVQFYRGGLQDVRPPTSQGSGFGRAVIYIRMVVCFLVNIDSSTSGIKPCLGRGHHHRCLLLLLTGGRRRAAP